MDNSLKKIISEGLSGLSNIFNSDDKNESALGIDIGSSAIKVVQLKKKMDERYLKPTVLFPLGPMLILILES